MPTMKDVAKAAGVSIATVSATISGATYVSSELKVRVHTAIDDLGYAPNAMASGLKRGTSSLIGLIVPDITNPFFTESVDCVQRQARDAGLTVLLGCSAGDAEQERSLIRLMHSHRVAGTILFPAGNRNDCREIAVLAGKMPLVAVDCAFDDMGIDTVVLDNRKAALLATRHILSHGHQTVAAVTGPSHQFASLERYEGFVAAMTEADLPVSPEYISGGEFRVDAAFNAGCELLALPVRPTAIFVANNHMLIGVMQAVAAAGLSVPRDISIASIDDFPWAAAFVPALTTVRQPIAGMARQAMTCLTIRMTDQFAEPCRIVCEPELMVRHSCAAPS